MNLIFCSAGKFPETKTVIWLSNGQVLCLQFILKPNFITHFHICEATLFYS